MSPLQAVFETLATEAVNVAAEWAVAADSSPQREIDMECSLCAEADDPAVHVVAHSREWRVVRVLDNDDHPAFWRVIWNAHVAEWTDLSAADRQQLMDLVAVVERAVRDTLHPHKINLASLGNVVPHLHWHIIARWPDDAHFPNPIWGERLRPSSPARLLQSAVALPEADRAIRNALVALRGAGSS